MVKVKVKTKDFLQGINAASKAVPTKKDKHPIVRWYEFHFNGQLNINTTTGTTALMVPINAENIECSDLEENVKIHISPETIQLITKSIKEQKKPDIEIWVSNKEPNSKDDEIKWLGKGSMHRVVTFVSGTFIGGFTIYEHTSFPKIESLENNFGKIGGRFFVIRKIFTDALDRVIKELNIKMTGISYLYEYFVSIEYCKGWDDVKIVPYDTKNGIDKPPEGILHSCNIIPTNLNGKLILSASILKKLLGAFPSNSDLEFEQTKISHDTSHVRINDPKTNISAYILSNHRGE